MRFTVITVRNEIKEVIDTPIDKMFKQTTNFNTCLYPENMWMAVIVGNNTSKIKRIVEGVIKNERNFR